MTARGRAGLPRRAGDAGWTLADRRSLIRLQSERDVPDLVFHVLRLGTLRHEQDVVDRLADLTREQGEHSRHDHPRPYPLPGEADHRADVPGEQDAPLRGRPLQDVGVRGAIESDILNPNEVECRLTSLQPADDVSVD